MRSIYLKNIFNFFYNFWLFQFEDVAIEIIVESECKQILMNKRKAILFHSNNALPKLFHQFLEQVLSIADAIDEISDCFSKVLVESLFYYFVILEETIFEHILSYV